MSLLVVGDQRQERMCSELVFCLAGGGTNDVLDDEDNKMLLLRPPKFTQSTLHNDRTRDEHGAVHVDHGHDCEPKLSTQF